jgi:MinD superfamily P-loop ATPase
MIVCWSVKGGSGTTVVAASLALVLARTVPTVPTVLADLGGDAPAALGLAEPAGPGLADWVASPTADLAALTRLAISVNDSLSLLPLGAPPPSNSVGSAAPAAERWAALGQALAALDRVVVDSACGVPPAPLLAAAEQSLLVIRPCYLAIRRAALVSERPSGIVVVREPGRALSSRDIEHALGVPVVADVPYDPMVARAVDAGLLNARLPRSIAHSLKDAA